MTLTADHRERDPEPSFASAAREEEINMGGVQTKEVAYAHTKDEDPITQLASEGDLGIAQPKRSTRPTTARRRPPKYKEKGLEVEMNDAKNSNDVLDTKTTIMIDGDNGDDEDPGADESLHGNKADARYGLLTDDALAASGKSKLVREIQEEERAAAKKVDEEKDDGSGGIRFGRIDRAVAGSKDKLSEADLQELQVHYPSALPIN